MIFKTALGLYTEIESISILPMTEHNRFKLIARSESGQTFNILDTLDRADVCVPKYLAESFIEFISSKVADDTEFFAVQEIYEEMTREDIYVAVELAVALVESETDTPRYRVTVFKQGESYKSCDTLYQVNPLGGSVTLLNHLGLIVIEGEASDAHLPAITESLCDIQDLYRKKGRFDIANCNNLKLTISPF